MTSKIGRKVIRTGNKEYVFHPVNIPISYLKEAGLQPGSKVDFTLDTFQTGKKYIRILPVC